MRSHGANVFGPFFSRNLMLPHHFTSGGARYVHSDVAAADHNNFLADGEFVAKIYIEKKVDAFIDAIQIDSGNRQVAAAMRAHGDEHSVEALRAQFLNRKIF